MDMGIPNVGFEIVASFTFRNATVNIWIFTVEVLTAGS